MLASSLAMLEISSWFNNDENIVSISNYIFGSKFTNILIFFYILFLYSLISAYISGGSSMLMDLFIIKYELHNISIMFKILFIAPFSFIIFLGMRSIDHLNKILFLLLIIAYIILIINIYVFLKKDINKFIFLDYKMILFSLPIMVTSFGYSLLIPSLKMYLNNNIKIICSVIFIGSLIPFIVYIIWEHLINNFFLSIGNKLLTQILFGEGNPTEKLIILMSSNNIITLYTIFIFSFFAISSSFIGVSLGIYDFFFDLLNMSKKNKYHKILILFLIYFFPLIFNIIYPYGFMLALSYAGVFASILLILFPVYTLWYGRYIKELKYKYILFDNKYFIFFIFFIGLIVIFIDIIDKCFI